LSDSAEDAANQAAARAKGVSAGRGVVYLAGAKFYFMLASYAVAFGLPRLFGSTELYGRFGVVNRVVSVLNMVMIGGTIQAVSRFVSADPSRAGAVTWLAVRLQIVLGLCAAGLYALAAPLIAELLGDPSLTDLLRLSAVIVACYAVYAALIGSLNGRRLFHRQAGLDATFSTIKAALMLGAAGLGFGVAGAIGGFSATAALILVPAFLLLGRMPPGGAASLRELVGFQVPIFGYTLALYLFLGLDLFSVKALIVDSPEAADRLAGLYTAAQYMGQLPYTAIVAVTFVVFPMISRATFVSDREAASSYVRTTLRYSALVLVLLAALLSADAGPALRFFYPAEYAEAAGALRLLAPGVLLFALMVIACTILSGSGRPVTSLLITLLGLCVSAGFNLLLTPRFGLPGAAAATGLAALAALVASGILLWRHFKAFLPALSLVRLLAAGGAVWLLASALPVEGRPLVAAKWTGLGVVYLVLLALLREISRDDLSRVIGSLSGRTADGS